MTVRAVAPGRANVIGEHTDHQRGLVLPFALQMGVTADARPRPDRTVHAHAVTMGERDAFDLGAARADLAAPGWRAYVRGTLWEADRRTGPLPGMDLVITADLPPGAGLSSSAALCSAVALAALALAGREVDRLELARLLQGVEHRWAGVRSGLMDQLAVLLARPGHALLADMGTLEVAHVPLGGARFACRHTGPRRLAEGGYGARVEQCAAAARAMELPDLRDAGEREADGLPEPLRRRALHVVRENARVRAAAAALRAGDLPALGALLDASHASLRDLFEVSTPAIERAVDDARRLGALGARVTGAGFGGAVLALFPGDAPDGWTPLPSGPAARVGPAGATGGRGAPAGR